MTEQDLATLGRLFLRLLTEDGVFAWLNQLDDDHPERNRLVVDGTVWDLNAAEIALVEQAKKERS